MFVGRLESVKLYGRIEEYSQDKFVEDEQYLSGLKSFKTRMQTDVDIQKLSGLSWSQTSETEQTISFTNFPPGSVLVIRYVM